MLGGCHAAAPAVEPVNGNGGTPVAHERRGPRMVVTDTEVEALSPIRFQGLSANPTDESRATLDAVASTLDGNPSILLVDVVAFGSDGAPEFQQIIAQQRAQAIVDYLVERGIARDRLRAQGVPRPEPGGSSSVRFEIARRRP